MVWSSLARLKVEVFGANVDVSRNATARILTDARRHRPIAGALLQRSAQCWCGALSCSAQRLARHDRLVSLPSCAFLR